MDKEQIERVLKLIRAEEKSDTEDKPVLEFFNGKVRCSDGQPSTHTKLEIQKDTLVKVATPQQGTLQSCDPSTYPTKYSLTVYETLMGLPALFF